MSAKHVFYTLNPQKHKDKTPAWRSTLVVVILALMCVGMSGRALWVQVINKEFYQTKGDKRLLRARVLPAHRGHILDRNGMLLASSVPAVDIWTAPSHLDRDDKAQLMPGLQPKFKELAHLLGMSLNELHAHFTDLDATYVSLKRRVPAWLGDRVAQLEINGIYHDKLYQRAYPDNQDAAHLIGYVNLELQGRAGIELAFDSKLAGKNGMHRYVIDAKKRVTENLERTEPIDGENVTLSIDSRLQSFVAKALCAQVAEHKAQAGSLVALDALTGEILALANCPSYDPYWTADTLVARKKFNPDSVRNRAISDVFEPGSTMKPFTAAMALELGRVRLDDLVDTAPGSIKLEGVKKPISDTRNFGVLTVEGVIQKSSNVGAVKISRKLTAQEMWNTYSALGYGRVPKIDYPRPLSGILHPWEKWRPADKDTMSYGYGISATLLQVARSYTVFANDGRLLPLTLLKTNGIPEGERVFSPRTTAQVLHMLGLAAGANGTGQRAQIEGYKVGGKSGTARKHAGKGKAYVEGQYRSWFVGLAPLEKPRVIIAVLIDEPNAGQIYGGVVAAPVFGKVAQYALRLLDLQPNLAIQPKFTATPTPEPVESGV